VLHHASSHNWGISDKILVTKLRIYKCFKRSFLMKTTLPSRRSILQLACATTATMLGTTASNIVFAQPKTPNTSLPINQLRILCSGPAGSIPDIVARRVAEQLTRQYPQGAIVDNRPGAAGQIAVKAQSPLFIRTYIRS
jgi:hypothetical protein